MPDLQLATFAGFDDPMDVVDSTDMTYEARLKILQEWQATLSRSGSGHDRQKILQGAIHALEMGAAVQDDGPEGAPNSTGYGVGDAGSPPGPQARET